MSVDWNMSRLVSALPALEDEELARLFKAATEEAELRLEGQVRRKRAEGVSAAVHQISRITSGSTYCGKSRPGSGWNEAAFAVVDPEAVTCKTCKRHGRSVRPLLGFWPAPSGDL